jgi:hypothetical protein
MTKILALLVLFPALLFAQTKWNGTVNTSWYTSAKTATTYTINTAEELAGLAVLVNEDITFEGKTIKLGENIVLNDTTGWRNWDSTTIGLNQWTPIGNYFEDNLHYPYVTENRSFCGNFDGNGKVISGLYTSTTANNQGLFGNANSNISNLGLAGFYVKGGGSVGSIAGFSYIRSGCGTGSGITVTNSYAIGNVKGGGSVGGIIGFSAYGATITDTYFIGDVTGDGRTGGIAGDIHTKVSITNSYVIGNVTGAWVGDHAGGIVGNVSVNEVIIADVYIIGNVTGGAVGGIVGNVNGYNEVTIANAYIIGDVTAIRYGAGGIVGNIYSYDNCKSTITDAYVIGNVTGSGNAAGGIVYYASGNGGELIISNTYVIGNITGDWAVGGIVGYGYSLVSKLTITDAYVIGNVTGDRSVGGIIGHGSIDRGFISISNIYFVGNVTGNSGVDAIIGASNGSTIGVTNSFYNSNLAPSRYGISKTKEEMKNILTYIEHGWDFSSIWAIDPVIGDGYPFLQNPTYAQGKKHISPVYVPSVVEKYTGLPIEPAVDSIMYNGTKLTKGTDYDLLYLNNIKTDNNAKIVIVGKGNYYGVKIVDFNITNQTRNMSDVTIEPVIPEQITGDSIKPKPVVKDFNNEVVLREGINYTLEYYDNKYAGLAIIKILGIGVYEGIRTINFSIVGRLPLMVNWSEEREFVYNKMVQVPKASIDASEDIQWRVVNARSTAGEYTEANKLAPFVQIISSNASSYELLNNTVDYEIKKRPLKPYFKAPATLPDFTSNTDTLWVPSEIFADSALLQQTLNSILSYDGFAQDTVTKEKDDVSVLKNSPTINLTYNELSQTQKEMLAKRVETTQTAVAVINTDGVSADNYTLAKRNIVIMETVETNNSGLKVFCLRDAYCTELSDDVCSFFGGVSIESCKIKMSCLVKNADESKCTANLSIDECRGIGGTVVSSCSSVPTSHSPLATSQLRITQTASGVVNLDLGYMPTAPVAVQIYNLQGKLISTGEASTRFATIRLNAGGGVYLFKAGNRNAVIVIK